MNLRHIAKAVAASAVLSAASMGASAAPILTNGNFEANDGNVASGSYTTVGAGSPLITGWTVGGNSVDLIQEAFLGAHTYGAISNVSVDLAGTPGPGTLSQTFVSTIGQLYHLTWDYSHNGDVPVALVVTFGDAVQHLYNPNTPGSGSLLWTALSTSTTVAFSASTFGNNGPVIDNVAVTAVPEPETYAMMLAGLGALGFMARRRKA